MSEVTPAGDLGASVQSAPYSTESKPEPKVEPKKEIVSHETKPEMVSREAYEKLLKEKKNAMLALEDLKSQKQGAEEARLRAEGKVEELLELEKQKSQKYESELRELKVKTENGIKSGALRKELEKMGANTKAMDLILGKLANMETLKYDEEHRVVLGVEDEALRIKEQLPELFGRSSAGVSHEAPKTFQSNIDIEAYKKLSPQEKSNPEVLKALFASKGVTVR